MKRVCSVGMHWYLSWALKKGESSKCRAGGKPWEVGRGGGGLTSVTAKPLHHARIPSPPGSPWCREGAWLLLQACFRKEARRDGWSPAGRGCALCSSAPWRGRVTPLTRRRIGVVPPLDSGLHVTCASVAFASFMCRLHPRAVSSSWTATRFPHHGHCPADIRGAASVCPVRVGRGPGRVRGVGIQAPAPGLCPWSLAVWVTAVGSLQQPVVEFAFVISATRC